MGDYNINGLAIPLFLLLIGLEFLLLRDRGLYRYNDSVNSLSMGMCLLVSDTLLKVYTFAVYVLLWQHYRVLDFAANDPLTWVVFFFGVDFCYYWFHRSAHSLNVLWGAHVGHHQSEEYNLSTALRQSAFQYAFSWVFYLPLALLGCPPEVFLVQFVILKVYQFWLHTQGIDRIPLIEGWMSTPSSHRVHHAKNPVYIDKNYGGTLVIWDRLFGSWQPELREEPCHYGTVKPLDTLSPVKANLQHWSMLAGDSWHTRRWRDKVRLWWMPTGWRPEDCAGNSALQREGCGDRPKYNPQTGRLINLYVAIAFATLVVLASGFIFFSPQLVFADKVLGVVVVIGGVIAINGLLEGQRAYWSLEVIRWPLSIWLAMVLVPML